MSHSNQANNYIDFFYHAFRNILLVGIPLVIISALILGFAPHSSAEVSGSTDNVSLTLSTSCTVNAVVTSEHTVSLNGGQLDNNVGNTKLSAFCNDNNGYSIYAVGSSNDIDGNTDLINTVNESYNIHTGVYNGNNASNPSSWAMKLTAGVGTGIDPTTGGSVPTTPPTIINGFDNYSTIPNVYTQVAKRTSGTSMTTDTSVSGSYLNTTYQIYANSAQPAGTYNGKVKYVIVHPNSNNNHLGFNEVYASQGKNPVNVESGAYYTMQDMSTNICDQVGLYNEASQTQLVDIRDNKLYWVAKLDDGKCWMTQNLDLDIVADSTNLTSNNTDLSTDESVYTAGDTIYVLRGAGNTYGYTYENGISTWIPERSTIAYNQLNSTNWQNSNTDPYSYDRLDSNGNPVYPDSNVTQAMAGSHGLSGNYYNWTASLASNDSTNATGNPANSICPKGWRLPNVTNKEFGNLLVQYDIINTNTSTSYINGVSSVNSMGASPLYFVRGGVVFGGSLNYSGSNGVYWSSTLLNGPRAYYLDYNSSSIDPQHYDNRSIGWSVRCLAR